MTIELAENGAIFNFATRKPGQVAAQPDASGAVVRRGAASGNPNFDPVTGKFAGGKLKSQKQGQQGGGNQQGGGVGGAIDATSAQRRRDLIRRAASAMEEMTLTQASKWLEQFGVDTSSADVAGFLAEVRNQRIDYLVDAMRPNLRATVDAQHQNQVVALKAPAVWTGGMIASLTDGEFLQLYQRLSGQGFDPQDVSTQLVKRVKGKKKKDELQQLFGETPGTQNAQQ